MTAPEFISAVEKSEATCLIPIGVLEKHGPHLPLGTDMLSIGEIAVRAAQKEYAIVFPHYYFGQIHEARHQPGTLAYSQELPFGYTAIWWYAKFPNHNAGDGSKANRELGNLLINSEVDQLAELIKRLRRMKQSTYYSNNFMNSLKSRLKQNSRI